MHLRFKLPSLILMSLLLITCSEEFNSSEQIPAPTPNYVLGGNIVGLTGTLILQNNDGDNLELSQNGAFVFDSPMKKDQSFAISILNAPPLQNCVLSNQNGTIEAMDILTVVVICQNKSWAHPSTTNDFISLSGERAYDPHIAMNAQGNAHVVWSQEDGSKTQIFMGEYTNGVWHYPTDLNDNISPNGQNTSDQQVAMDDKGDAIIVWRQSNGIDDQIFMSEYRTGVWTHPANLNDNISPDGEYAFYPKVAMSNNGNAIVTWRQSNGTRSQIFISEYKNGVWTHPANLNDSISPSTQSALDPDIAMDSTGDAIITWRQSNGSDDQTFISEYRNGTWVHPSDINDNISPNGESASKTKVAMDDNGNAIVVWRQSNGSNSQVLMSEYRNGIWVHPSNLSDNISPNGQNIDDPHLSMDNNGNALVSWSQSDGLRRQIFISEYRNGTWVHPSNLNDNISPDGESANNPQIAMDNIGNARVIWSQDDGSDEQVFMSEYLNNTWVHPSGLNDTISPEGENVFLPQVSMSDAGNALIAWTTGDSSEGDLGDVFLSIFQ